MKSSQVLPQKGDHWFAHARTDVPAGVVVFLVALPLCLGIAQASGAPPLSGLIAGIVGGLVVPIISKSHLSVSGPAAGLTVLVAAAIEELGFPAFFLAVVLAGLFQVALGTLRLGLIAHFLPSSVIKGMLAAIGILIILKQLPHAVGYDLDFEGDEAFVEVDGHNTLSALADAFDSISWGAVAVSLAAVAGALGWPLLQARVRQLKVVPVPLVTVALGVGAVALTRSTPWLGLSDEHFVSLPTVSSVSDLAGLVSFPAFDQWSNPAVWKHAVTLALVASLETLLSVEAVDGLDPKRRITPPNRELVAQGVSNACSGLIGGIPLTSVIIRSSANVHAGGQTRLSAVTHGALLLFGLLVLGPLLNSIPLAALAVVLIHVGLKLNSVKLWTTLWHAGASQFVPFAATIAAILFTDLLTGTLLGAMVGLGYMIRAQQRDAILITRDGTSVLLTFVKDITFLQKAQIKETLSKLPSGAHVSVDRRAVAFVDADVDELLDQFSVDASSRQITFTQVFEPGGEARFLTRHRHRNAA